MGIAWSRFARGVLALTATLATACGRQRAPRVIGYAYASVENSVVALARETMRAWPGFTPPEVLSARRNVSWAGPAGEVQRAAKLVAMPGLVGVVGPASSRETLVSAPIYDEAGIPVIIPNANSRLLRQGGPWLFRLAPDDSIEGDFIAGYAAGGLRVHAVVVLYENDEYGLGLRDGVKAGLAARHVPVVADLPLSGPCADAAGRLTSETDLAIETVRRTGADAVLLASQSALAACLARAIYARNPRVHFLAGDGVESANLILAGVGPAAGAFSIAAFWYPAFPDSVSRAFVTRFRAAADRDPSPHEALEYDALITLARAVREVGPSPRAVRAYLLSLGLDRPPLAGVTGAIGFGPGFQRPLFMVRIDRGRAVPVAAP
ncbi:MAG TPA: ABC transporter substrate-binding protein [Gemmatimonadales bacterium]|nr:ABC transporter substrate-binding protein [Gemmatimonadales bacterium]